MIFDDFTRVDSSPMRNLETSFEFLNRSARTEITRVRAFIELCISTYPESERPEFIARIRSGDDQQFRSAMFELLLYSFLEKIGCKLDPHPELNNGSKSHPDFLVTMPSGESFYLEAVLASEVSHANEGGDAIKGAVFDVLASESHPDFLIDVLDKGHPTTQPSGKKLAKKVLEWLDSINPDEIRDVFDREGLDGMPAYQWEHEQWSLTFRPIPLKQASRGKAKSLIGAFVGKGGYFNHWTPIRDAVKRKGAKSKYGQLNLPLLVAVNIDTFSLDQIDEIQALFGEETVIDVGGSNGFEPRIERLPNGLWYGPDGPMYKGVSGAWIFNDLTPYTITKRRNTVYLNPWAAQPLPEDIAQFPHAKVGDNKIEHHSGISLCEIFKLSKDWPIE